MEDLGLEVPQEIYYKGPLFKKQNKDMSSVKNQLDFLMKEQKTSSQKERIKYNMEKALSMNADITYKDTEDGKVIITVTKDGKSTENTFDNIDKEVKEGIDIAMAIRKKAKSKNEAKNAVKVRYKVGDLLILRGKIKDGSEPVVKKFEVKKVIWSIHANPVNILILKQIEGINNNRSLDKNDCKKYHIKYEPGLQVYSMMLNFSKIRRR